jgi:hypothetical protein
MVATDLSLIFELLAAVLTVLYIGKLLLQKNDFGRFYSDPYQHIYPHFGDNE